ncbi:MAG: MoxR family ATPase [Holophagales bacterium]|nr:MoxR family ATPase [Holophagales bacterium]
MFETLETTRRTLEAHDYVADDGVATSLFLAFRMGKALFLEGEPGVGKTELAKVVSRALDAPLIRLQCYEGLDLQQAVYEWNYPRQLLAIQARSVHEGRADGGAGAAGSGAGGVDDIFTEAFLLRRPLLQALDPSLDRAPVLLIDALDRADEEFESFLLELLSDFQITIPELGTLRARHRPICFLTSNRTREIHDALKRRCVYQWIDYPDAGRELRIVRAKIPGIGERLAAQVVGLVQALRQEDLYKWPGVAETLDWGEALVHLGAETLDRETVQQTLGFLLKYQDDVDRLRGAELDALVEKAGGG